MRPGQRGSGQTATGGVVPRAMPEGRGAGRTAPAARRGAGSVPRLARRRRSRSEATLWDDFPTATSQGEPAVSDQEPFRSPPAAARDRGSHDEPWRLADIPITREETTAPRWASRVRIPRKRTWICRKRTRILRERARISRGRGRWPGEGAASRRARATSLPPCWAPSPRES